MSKSNLLPKSHGEFHEADYWEKFFKRRGAKAFEWYGSYLQLTGVIHKYLKPQDVILHAGCGNSTFGVDLLNVGYKNIINADISSTVISQMSKKYPLARFVEMDLLNSTFQDGEFTAVLDKGTLDALMSEDDADSLDRAVKYFREIERVLKLGGRFVCISLLQTHILKALVSFFPEKHFMFRIVRCPEAEKPEDEEENRSFVFPVFTVICTKFKPMPNGQQILEFSADGEKFERLSSRDALVGRVKSIQDFAFMAHKMAESSVAENQSFDLFDPSGKFEKIPKYSLFIADRKRKVLKSMAAFIVPQGSESDWMFRTPEGRDELAERSNVDRLVVVHLNRGHHFANLESVKSELTPYILDLRPSTLPSSANIPFLSLGSDIGNRKTVFKGKSEYSGDFIVEDVQDGEKTLRRLIFMDKPNIIQSEMVVGQKLDAPSCTHHAVMTSCLHLLVNPSPRALVIGLGGGELCKYLRKEFKNAIIDVVDIDAAVVQVAKEYFGFLADKKMKVLVGDGLKIIEETEKAGTVYDCIMFDVDSKDRTLGISCPPPPFVTSDFLATVKKCLTPDGIFALNLVARDLKWKENVRNNILTHFGAMKACVIPDEVNEVLICAAEDSFGARAFRTLNRGKKKGKPASEEAEAMLKFYDAVKKVESDVAFS